MVLNERQDFRGSIVMWAIILIELPTLILLTVLYFIGNLGEDGWKMLLIIGAIMLSAFLLIINIRLELRVDEYGIAFRNPPIFNNWTKFKKEDLQNVYIKKSDGLLEYGGIGVRFSRKIKAYIYFSDHIFIVETKNKKYVFSTHKHMEIEKIIASWKSEEEVLSI
ncbi:hypothetical protein [Belliella aquatica]|uniref:Bacterial Pleckstrin homology domain-containing protein n=1 Tax=Belliella aquatica TaxID=1323734 RepID=A0ABQ1N824_9BACT|nr:hypothetical protein [Belliella aquatica]MCH7407466.1 hypothetical protein [Belliella aquatica]GGC53819.1 hypothetical protein GCM10010993_35290 [Belliella aquatica]